MIIIVICLLLFPTVVGNTFIINKIENHFVRNCNYNL